MVEVGITVIHRSNPYSMIRNPNEISHRAYSNNNNNNNDNGKNVVVPLDRE
jgi:hypothetical protein